MITCNPHSKDGQNLNSLFYEFSETLQFEGVTPQLLTLHVDLQPTNMCQNKKLNYRCLGYVAFECHAIFEINMESHRIKTQQRLGNGAPKPRGDKCQVLIHERAHCKPI